MSDARPRLTRSISLNGRLFFCRFPQRLPVTLNKGLQQSSLQIGPGGTSHVVLSEPRQPSFRHRSRGFVVVGTSLRSGGAQRFDDADAHDSYAFVSLLLRGGQSPRLAGAPQQFAWVPYGTALYLPLWFRGSHNEWWRLRRVPVALPPPPPPQVFVTSEAPAEAEAGTDLAAVVPAAFSHPAATDGKSQSSQVSFDKARTMSPGAAADLRALEVAAAGHGETEGGTAASKPAARLPPLVPDPPAAQITNEFTRTAAAGGHAADFSVSAASRVCSPQAAQEDCAGEGASTRGCGGGDNNGGGISWGDGITVLGGDTERARDSEKTADRGSASMEQQQQRRRPLFMRGGAVPARPQVPPPPMPSLPQDKPAMQLLQPFTSPTPRGEAGTEPSWCGGGGGGPHQQGSLPTAAAAAAAAAPPGAGETEHAAVAGGSAAAAAGGDVIPQHGASAKGGPPLQQGTLEAATSPRSTPDSNCPGQEEGQEPGLPWAATSYLVPGARAATAAASAGSEDARETLPPPQQPPPHLQQPQEQQQRGGTDAQPPPPPQRSLFFKGCAIPHRSAPSQPHNHHRQAPQQSALVPERPNDRAAQAPPPPPQQQQQHSVLQQQQQQQQQRTPQLQPRQLAVGLGPGSSVPASAGPAHGQDASSSSDGSNSSSSSGSDSIGTGWGSSEDAQAIFEGSVDAAAAAAAAAFAIGGMGDVPPPPQAGVGQCGKVPPGQAARGRPLFVRGAAIGDGACRAAQQTHAPTLPQPPTQQQLQQAQPREQHLLLLQPHLEPRQLTAQLTAPRRSRRQLPWGLQPAHCAGQSAAAATQPATGISISSDSGCSSSSNGGSDSTHGGGAGGSGAGGAGGSLPAPPPAPAAAVEPPPPASPRLAPDFKSAWLSYQALLQARAGPQVPPPPQGSPQPAQAAFLTPPGPQTPERPAVAEPPQARVPRDLPAPPPTAGPTLSGGSAAAIARPLPLASNRRLHEQRLAGSSSSNDGASGGRGAGTGQQRDAGTRGSDTSAMPPASRPPPRGPAPAPLPVAPAAPRHEPDLRQLEPSTQPAAPPAASLAVGTPPLMRLYTAAASGGVPSPGLRASSSPSKVLAVAGQDSPGTAQLAAAGDVERSSTAFAGGAGGAPARRPRGSAAHEWELAVSCSGAGCSPRKRLLSWTRVCALPGGDLQLPTAVLAAEERLLGLLQAPVRPLPPPTAPPPEAAACGGVHAGTDDVEYAGAAAVLAAVRAASDVDVQAGAAEAGLSRASLESVAASRPSAAQRELLWKLARRGRLRGLDAAVFRALCPDAWATKAADGDGASGAALYAPAGAMSVSSSSGWSMNDALVAEGHVARGPGSAGADPAAAASPAPGPGVGLLLQQVLAVQQLQEAEEAAEEARAAAAAAASGLPPPASRRQLVFVRSLLRRAARGVEADAGPWLRSAFRGAVPERQLQLLVKELAGDGDGEPSGSGAGTAGTGARGCGGGGGSARYRYRGPGAAASRAPVVDALEELLGHLSREGAGKVIERLKRHVARLPRDT